VHEDQVVARGEGARVLAGLEQVLALEHHGRAVDLGVADLGVRRAFRHHDQRGDAEARGVVGDRLGVVARAHRDHPAAALGRVERKELVQRAALLEGGGELLVLELEEHLGAGELRQRAAVHAGGVLDRPGDARGRGADSGK